MTFSIVALITLASTVNMLVCTSPEFSWDEADYVANMTTHWGPLRRGAAYPRHAHGPMGIYLAKLGHDFLPAALGSIEGRLRFFVALVGSLAAGLLYALLRRSFETSRPAALAGSGLLLFSVIRVEETNVIGPHHLMLVATLAIVALGYRWRDRPTLRAAIGLGAVMGYGLLTMTYVIPAALCWAIAVALAGREWISWDRKHFKVSWLILVMLATAAVLVLVLWPPGVRQNVIVNDFLLYLGYTHHPTLVGERIYEVTPRWAAAYWLASLDAPILAGSVAIIALALWRALRTGLSSKHVYLAVCLAFFLAISLAAHLAGARNLLQFVGVLCLATGALFDEALEKPRLICAASAAIIAAAALNFWWHARDPGYAPALATDGYKALLQQEGGRLRENAKALVYGGPILKFYAQQSATPVAWDVNELPWTTRADVPLAPDVKYVLMPAFVYEHMPADQPMRRVVAAHWKPVWSYKVPHVWELRLYQNPAAP